MNLQNGMMTMETPYKKPFYLATACVLFVCPDEKEAKYAAMFDNRVSRGRCFMQPYLGCREFSCSSFRLIREPEKETQTPISETRDLGFMLYDMDYSNPKDIKPMFYRPKMENGVIIVPDVNSLEVYK